MADMFLLLDGVTGESQDEAKPIKRAGAMEIISWGWILNNSANWKMSMHEAASKTDVKTITVDKHYDRASATLIKYCCLGQHIPSGQIICRKNAGELKLEYLVISMKEVMVKSIDWKGGPDRSPETITLSFSKFEVKYTPQPQETGASEAPIEFRFDITTHKEI